MGPDLTELLCISSFRERPWRRPSRLRFGPLPPTRPWRSRNRSCWRDLDACPAPDTSWHDPKVEFFFPGTFKQGGDYVHVSEVCEVQLLVAYDAETGRCYSASS